MTSPRPARVALGAVALLAAAALGGCSSDDGTTAEAPVQPSTTAASSASSTPTPDPTPTQATTSAAPEPTPSETVAESPSGAVEPTPSATPTSAAPTPTPTAAPTRSGAQRGLRSARNDARTISPQLQAYFDEREYPVDLAQLESTLGDAGVTLGAGNSIGGYGLAGNGVDFVLCVEHDGGGWASYDTEAGKVDDSGTTGACPGSASAG